MPRVTVIVPNYNYGRYIGETIDHVIRQTFSGWELIVVDDNSTDNSREIVQDYIRRYPDREISLVVNERGPSGTPAPINIGISRMRGDYFAWLSSDDVFEPEKLEFQLRAFEARPGLALVHTAFTTIDEAGNHTGSFYPPNEFETDAFTGLLDGNFINGNTVLIRREALEQMGPFLETDPDCHDLWRAAEYFHWLKIARLYPIQCIQHPLHRSRRHAGNAEYNSSPMGSALERMLIRRFFNEHDVKTTPEIIAALVGRGLGSLALRMFGTLSEEEQQRTFSELELLERDQERWDIGQYNRVRRLDNGRIRSAFRAISPAQAQSMLRAVAGLERPQTKPYRAAAIARLAKMEMAARSASAAARSPKKCLV
ncbi:MAG: glycosyltransferase [Acidobacteria bacterium]|nr:glycosyltransferase [Acidobacteriota bacterium]